MGRCLICGKELHASEMQYHQTCSRHLFQSPQSPLLGYSWDDLNTLAKTHVLQRISVPGMQPKLSLHLEHTSKTNGRFTIVGLKGDYILKPPSHQYALMPEWEHFCLLFAKMCKIPTIQQGLILLASGERAFITRRMDRTEKGCLHMEDFCQLTNKQTEQKYQGSMEQIGKTLLRFSSFPGLDAVRFFELTLFCFLTGNSDMHLKNFSLLRNETHDLQLAPAYDLLPVRMILPKDSEEMALTLNGKKSNLTLKDFRIFAQTIHLSPVQVENTIRQMVKRSQKQLTLALEQSFLPENEKTRFQQLFHERIERLAPPSSMNDR